MCETQDSLSPWCKRCILPSLVACVAPMADDATPRQLELMQEGHEANSRGDTVTALIKFRECFHDSERLEARISAANMCLKLGQTPTMPLIAKGLQSKLNVALTVVAETSERRKQLTVEDGKRGGTLTAYVRSALEVR